MRIPFAAAAIAALTAAVPAAALAQQSAPVYQQPLSAQATLDLQKRLRSLGFYAGPLDGAWGAGTRAAVERFQRERGLAVTGELNQATVTAMGLDPDRLLARGYAPRPAAPAEAVPARIGPVTTEAVQEQLRRRGYYVGAVDGVWGARTRLALEHFQRAAGLPVTGLPSRQSLTALGLNPDRFATGSSVPSDTAAERLNRRELSR